MSWSGASPFSGLGIGQGISNDPQKEAQLNQQYIDFNRHMQQQQISQQASQLYFTNATTSIPITGRLTTVDGLPYDPVYHLPAASEESVDDIIRKLKKSISKFKLK